MSEASPEFLRHQAERFLELAREIVDEHGQWELIKLAEEYEARADALSGYEGN